MAAKAKIAVIYYSTYGHITQLTNEVVNGAKGTGAHVDVFQIPETLSDDILAKQHAIPRPDVPVIGPHQLPEYDGFIFGFPTRYGRAPAQVSAFFDSTGKEWATGALVGKFATVYTSAASQHGGLETTQLTTMPFFIHHGISYVPSGFASSELTKLDEIIGGSAYGAGTIAGGDGSRQPTTADLTVAKAQGTHFSTIVNTFVAGKAAIARHAGNNNSETTYAAEAVPASVTAAAAAASINAAEHPTEAKPYEVDAPTTTQTTTQPEATSAPADTTAAEPAAPAATKEVEATPVAAAPAAATATEKPAAAAAPKKEKKSGLFARCCGSQKDYDN